MSDAIEDQIRLGLRLLAEDVQAPVPSQRPVRTSRRVAGLAFGVVLLMAAAVAFVALGHSSPRTSVPRFVPDAFNYRPATLAYRQGGVSGPFSGPGLPYSVPILSDVAASSGQNAWIVGSGARAGSVCCQGVTWHWDGSPWRAVAFPRLAGNVDLSAVATTADGEAWIVGFRSGPADYRVAHALAEHWDGSRWRAVRLPRTGVSSLGSVSASGPSNVWAVGTSYRRDARGKFPGRLTRLLVLHWDGSTWSVVAAPWTERPGFDTKVVTTGPNDVWLYDGAQIEHWDGARWQAVPAPFGPADPLRGFSATAADDAWAVGSYSRGRHSRTLAAHWSGSSWQIAPTPNRSTDSDLNAVVAVGPDDVWAVGRSARIRYFADGMSVGGLNTLFEHWDGRSWKVMPGNGPSIWGGLPMLAATEDGTAWATGSCRYDNALAGWNGSAWAIVPHPPDRRWYPGTPARVRHPFGPACGSS
jgi:hypothetical protein